MQRKTLHSALALFGMIFYGCTDDNGNDIDFFAEKEEDKAEMLRIEIARQNNKLFMENTKYLNHLIYSICEFDYDESLSLREMLKETDDNLKNMKRMEMTGK